MQDFANQTLTIVKFYLKLSSDFSAFSLRLTRYDPIVISELSSDVFFLKSVYEEVIISYIYDILTDVGNKIVVGSLK